MSLFTKLTSYIRSKTAPIIRSSLITNPMRKPLPPGGQYDTNPNQEPFLSLATHAEARAIPTEYPGFVYGRMSRIMSSMVVSHEGKSLWVLFIVDTGSPVTLLSIETYDAFGMKGGHPVLVKIAGRTTNVQQSSINSNHTHLNLLGADYHLKFKVVRLDHYPQKYATLYFRDSLYGKIKVGCRFGLW
ncbi:hypothetical protein B9Z19DRAFT_1068581 [Tuber borchii]|uniref:Peptidase A2 domain-containing protein n=1 Tax=Tuber borchii TaxID=42251 RepID=A0A2T6ZEX9_TUBBO|nr:hypothetical protein B9Z19DRAFT_1068581 [Tuber borchii]